MKRTVSILVLLLFTFPVNRLVLNVRGDANGSLVDETLSVRLNDYLNRSSTFGFSGVVLVAKDGKVLLKKAWGFADQKRNVLNDTDTLFLIGSLSKQFTAAAILRLEVVGKLNTSDLISKHIADVPPDKAKITIHHLLTHTSGLPTSYPALSESPALNIHEAVNRIMKTPLIFPTGKQYAYSNIGYLLLAAIVEQVSGRSFRDYLRYNLFKPAGMSHTSFAGDTSLHRKERVAHGYNRSVDWGTPDARLTRKSAFGFGDIMSTVDDLYRWKTALQRDSILSEEAKAKFFAPQTPIEDGVDYAYGWQISRTVLGSKLISHGGDASPEGWTAEFRWYVDDSAVVIILANQMRDMWGVTHAVKDNIEQLILGKQIATMPPASIRIAPRVLSRFIGTYSLPSGDGFKVWKESNRLLIAAEGQEAIDLLLGEPDDKTSYRSRQFNQQALAIVRGMINEDYAPLQIALERMGHRMTLAEARASYGERWVKWRTLEQQYGPLRSTQILGTVRLAVDYVWVTHVRVNFERGTRIYRWYWWPEGIQRVYADDYLPLTNPLAPASLNEFNSFDLFVGANAKVSFNSKVRGVVTGLTLHGKTGPSIARKIE